MKIPKLVRQNYKNVIEKFDVIKMEWDGKERCQGLSEEFRINDRKVYSKILKSEDGMVLLTQLIAKAGRPNIIKEWKLRAAEFWIRGNETDIEKVDFSLVCCWIPTFTIAFMFFALCYQWSNSLRDMNPDHFGLVLHTLLKKNVSLVDILFDDLEKKDDGMFASMIGIILKLKLVHPDDLTTQCFDPVANAWSYPEFVGNQSIHHTNESKQDDIPIHNLQQQHTRFQPLGDAETYRKLLTTKLRLNRVLVSSGFINDRGNEAYRATWSLDDCYRAATNTNQLSEWQQQLIDFGNETITENPQNLSREIDLLPLLEIFNKSKSEIRKHIPKIFHKTVQLVHSQNDLVELPPALFLFLLVWDEPTFYFLLTRWSRIEMYVPPPMDRIIIDQFWNKLDRIFIILADKEFHQYYDDKCEITGNDVIATYLAKAGPRGFVDRFMSNHSMWNIVITNIHLARTTRIFPYVFVVNITVEMIVFLNSVNAEDEFDISIMCENCNIGDQELELRNHEHLEFYFNAESILITDLIRSVIQDDIFAHLNEDDPTVQSYCGQHKTKDNNIRVIGRPSNVLYLFITTEVEQDFKEMEIGFEDDKAMLRHPNMTFQNRNTGKAMDLFLDYCIIETQKGIRSVIVRDVNDLLDGVFMSRDSFTNTEPGFKLLNVESVILKLSFRVCGFTYVLITLFIDC